MRLDNVAQKAPRGIAYRGTIGKGWADAFQDALNEFADAWLRNDNETVTINGINVEADLVPDLDEMARHPGCMCRKTTGDRTLTVRYHVKKGKGG